MAKDAALQIKQYNNVPGRAGTLPRLVVLWPWRQVCPQVHWCLQDTIVPLHPDVSTEWGLWHRAVTGPCTR